MTILTQQLQFFGGMTLSFILQVSFTESNCVIIAAKTGTIAKKKLCTVENKNPGQSFSFGKKSRFLVRENILHGQGDINTWHNPPFIGDYSAAL